MDAAPPSVTSPVLKAGLAGLMVDCVGTGFTPRSSSFCRHPDDKMPVVMAVTANRTRSERDETTFGANRMVAEL
jgi:hypothetical protein